ncbi:MAG: uncharacterized protein AUK63_897 [bacterium P3]|nr:MAG: uncharacterized protein AUK64_1054 [bacterium P201]KWW30451.1 MAG: uncharacterized protein AUK63_897 [bacterium P3]KWW41338.1 MAG: uncharacterized protein F083_1085 [bacterium F083]
MLSPIPLLALAVLPVAVLLVFIYRKDRYEREPLPLLMAAFGLGLVSVLPASLLEAGMSLFQPSDPVAAAFFNGFCVAGLCEELTKLLLLSWLIWRSRYFDEYFDGIVYAVFLSLGFACSENVMYVFGQDTFAASIATGSMRALLAVPAHFLFAVIMGYHFALAKFDISRRWRHLFRALLYPLLLHGTYDTLLMLSSALGDIFIGGLFVAFVIFDIYMWRWGMRRIRRLQELSQQQQFDRSHPFAGFKWFSLLLLILPLQGRAQPSAEVRPPDKTRLLIILNCSHSMWDQWQSDAKIKVTQKVLLRFLDSIAPHDDIEVALRVFGHLNRGAYTTRLEVPFAAGNNYALQSKIKTLVPNGGNTAATALTNSLNDFPVADASRNIIVIITDGIDDTDGDICKVARQVQLSGIVVQTFILGIGTPDAFRHSLDCAGNFSYLSDEADYTEALYDIFRRSEARAPVLLELLDQGARYETRTPVVFYNHTTQVAQHIVYYTSDGIVAPDTLWVDPLVEYDVVVGTQPHIRIDKRRFSSSGVNRLSIPVDEGTLRLHHASHRTVWPVPQYDVLVRRHGSDTLLTTLRMGEWSRLRAGRYDLDILSAPRRHLEGVTVQPGNATDIEIAMPGMLNISKPRTFVDGILFVDSDGLLEEVHPLNPNLAVERLVLQPGSYLLLVKPQNATAYSESKTIRFQITSAQTTDISL